MGVPNLLRTDVTRASLTAPVDAAAPVVHLPAGPDASTRVAVVLSTTIPLRLPVLLSILLRPFVLQSSRLRPSYYLLLAAVLRAFLAAAVTTTAARPAAGPAKAAQNAAVRLPLFRCLQIESGGRYLPRAAGAPGYMS